jgi:hypothetical protein
VDLPRPRRWATLASSPRMAELRAEVLDLLQAGTGAVAGAAR